MGEGHSHRNTPNVFVFSFCANMIMINDSNKTIKFKLTVLKLMQYVLTFNIPIFGISEGMFDSYSLEILACNWCIVIIVSLPGARS